MDAADRMAIFDASACALLRVGENGVPRSGIDADRNNLAPRVGASWALRQDGSSCCVAATASITTRHADRELRALLQPAVLRPSSLRARWPERCRRGTRFQRPPASGRPSRSTRWSRCFRPRIATGQLGDGRGVRGVDLSARYVGAHGTSLVRKRNINQPAPASGAVDERRPIPGYGDILLVEAAASSIYSRVAAACRTAARKGLSLRGAYTWAKSIDDGSAFLAE